MRDEKTKTQIRSKFGANAVWPDVEVAIACIILVSKGSDFLLKAPR
jgi:hypothetical protein